MPLTEGQKQALEKLKRVRRFVEEQFAEIKDDLGHKDMNGVLKQLFDMQEAIGDVGGDLAAAFDD